MTVRRLGHAHHRSNELGLAMVQLALRCNGNQPIQSGPLSGPLLIIGHLVTLYFCLIVLRVWRPLLGTNFLI